MKYTEEERLKFARETREERPDNIIHHSANLHSTVIYWVNDQCSGKDGFGYVRQEDGSLLKMPHTGNIVIEKDVVIGQNTCIDRAVVGSTIIGEGTKIDNLVHVAHGAQVGKHCLIVAGAVLGGSCEIGDYCYIGMGALIKNKIKVGKNVTVGMGAVVTKDIPDGETWIGNPARKLEK
jgi:UDP-3-O-[3-hydroxymyristoyl] glucosamine N-acyltransferase